MDPDHPCATFISGQDDIKEVEIIRPLANYHPDIWAHVFLDYTPLDQVTQNQKESEVCTLKERVRNELLTGIKSKKEKLFFIDAIDRLGVAYHFEEEIEGCLQEIYNHYEVDCFGDDFHYISLRFRILRQHGFCLSCDVFEKCKDENGSFKESLLHDVPAILSLYEASQLRLRGEIVLDEALDFTTTHLTSLASSVSSPMAEKIKHALNRPLHRCTTRMESKYQISFYEWDSSCYEALLKLAKLDFNLLQLLHKKELSELIRWSKSLDFTRKFPYARDRVVEAYIWTLGVYYEPKYSSARIALNKVYKILGVIDDIYDAYGTIEELESFTQAILRWNNNCVNQIPDYMKPIYQILLSTFQEFEQDLANEGRSYVVYYLRKELQATCQAYLQEARWNHEKYIPTYDEYMKNAIVSCAYYFMFMATYQGKGTIAANKDSIESIYKDRKAMNASCIIARLLNDMGGHKFEQKREHVASAMECYMSNFGALEEEAYKELQQRVEEAWKDLNTELFRPSLIPKPLLMRILNMSKALYDLYDRIDADAFTMSEYMQPKIEALLIEHFV